jgi:hypothetical protein
MDWDYGHTAWFLSTASGHGLGLWSHSMVCEYGVRAWIGITVTQPGLRVRPQGMDWDYGHSLVLEYGLRARIRVTITQPGLGVRPQGMDWDYSHTAWFSSTDSGHGLELRSHSLVLEYGLRA